VRGLPEYGGWVPTRPAPTDANFIWKKGHFGLRRKNELCGKTAGQHYRSFSPSTGKENLWIGVARRWPLMPVNSGTFVVCPVTYSIWYEPESSVSENTMALFHIPPRGTRRGPRPLVSRLIYTPFKVGGLGFFKHSVVFFSPGNWARVFPKPVYKSNHQIMVPSIPFKVGPGHEVGGGGWGPGRFTRGTD